MSNGTDYIGWSLVFVGFRVLGQWGSVSRATMGEVGVAMRIIGMGVWLYLLSRPNSPSRWLLVPLFINTKPAA